MPDAVRVKGLRELDRAFRRMDKELSRDLRKELKEAAEIVAAEARSRLSGVSATAAKSADTIEGRALARGAVVRQKRSRTTGQRPDFGVLQMRRAFIPALAAKTGEVVEKVDGMLERLGSRNGF